MSTDAGVWLGGLLTIAVFSLMWKENPFYRVAEFALVGVSSGYALTLGWENIVNRGIEPLMKGNAVVLIPLVLSLLLFAKLDKKSAWLARYPMAVMIGLGTAVSLRAAVKTDFINQIGATMLPLTTLDNVIIVVGTLSVLTYFFFTVGLKSSAQQRGAQLGRAVMMISFGAQLGSVAMQRAALLIGRIDFIFRVWLGIVKS
jgi:hypothetical protein